MNGNSYFGFQHEPAGPRMHQANPRMAQARAHIGPRYGPGWAMLWPRLGPVMAQVGPGYKSAFKLQDIHTFWGGTPHLFVMKSNVLNETHALFTESSCALHESHTFLDENRTLV